MESHASQPEFLPTTSELRQAFYDEVHAIGGKVSDVYDNETVLYARAVLESFADVRVGDRVQAGLALRASGSTIQVHPYTSRLVCTNGAIVEQALQSRRITRVEVEKSVAWTASYECAAALAEVADAIRACARPEAFTDAVQDMRSAAGHEFDHEMTVQIFRRLSDIVSQERLFEILDRFLRDPDPDRSAFGLLNALTSAARDTRDPEIRWRLEELGAAVPALLPRHGTIVATARNVAVAEWGVAFPPG